MRAPVAPAAECVRKGDDRACPASEDMKPAPLRVGPLARPASFCDPRPAAFTPDADGFVSGLGSDLPADPDAPGFASLTDADPPWAATSVALTSMVANGR